MKRSMLFHFVTFLLYLFIFFGVASANGSGIFSDDFSTSSLDSRWTFIDPLGDATLTMTGTNVSISVPAGVSHDVWTDGNYAPRIMQPANNTDFEIEVKFESALSQEYQTQGIIIEEDSNNFLRFDFHCDGVDTKVFAATFTAGTPDTKINEQIEAGVPIYMRVKREGNQWTQSYSYNGQNWVTSVSFTHSLTVTSVGEFIGNSGSSPPSHTGLIDYFFNTSSPIVPEDGGDSTPPTINIWYGQNQTFGHIGIPQVWVNILGKVWDIDGVKTLSYSLNGGPELLSMGPDGRRLQSQGNFNIEIAFDDLSCGPNQVDITATDNFNNTNVETVNVQYACGNIWPDSYSIDWSSVSKISDVAQIADGRWTLETDGIRPAIIGYDRIIAIGNITWTDYEVEVPVTIHSLYSRPPYHSAVGIAMRWSGHYDWDSSQPRWGWWPLGAIGAYAWDTELKDYHLHVEGNASMSIAKDLSGRHLEIGVPYMFKMRAETVGDNSVYYLKVWEEDTPEPSEWDLTGSGLEGELTAGSLLLMAHYVDASFGDVTVSPGPFIPHTITATAGSGGDIAPSGEVIVNYGADQTFTITPDTGYHVADVEVDGSSVGAVSSYTFYHVTANHTIEATFAVNTYTITATAGSGGTITPSGSIIVSHGSDQAFTITPDTGYDIADVKVDGSSVGAVPSYTFSNVTANHTIEATFALTLLEPNGGEVIPTASTYTIRWRAKIEAVKFKLLYSVDNGLTWIPITTDFIEGTICGDDKCYDWKVPKQLGNKKNTCLVKVKGYNKLSVKVGADVSDAPFTIEVIKLTTPNGGEVLTCGVDNAITWKTYATKGEVTKVKLYYTKDAGTTWNLITTLRDPSNPNPGRYDLWKPTCTKLKPNCCKVKVELKDSLGNILGTDKSDSYFTIQP